MPRQRQHQSASGFEIRAFVFSALAIALVGAVAYSLWPKDNPTVEAGSAGTASGVVSRTVAPAAKARADLTLRIDMSGFAPARLQLPSGREARLLIVNPDSSHHTDGGGVHQFAVPTLGIDIRVPPETNMLVDLSAAAAGEYPFYCDTCCGGKENPSMQGVLKVG